MWNFDHYLFNTCSPIPPDPFISSVTNLTNSSRHSFISQISFADEATETNLRGIEINQRTNIDLLISNSWPKSSRNTCGEKRIINIEADQTNLPAPNPSSPSEMIRSEFYIGNPNASTSPLPNPIDINTASQNGDPSHNESDLGIERNPSDPGIVSNSFVRYIDWGPAEFIDDF